MSNFHLLGLARKLDGLKSLLSDGTMRCSDIRGEMANVTDAALASALKDLLADGLIVRTQHDEIPPRVEYALSAKGESVIPVLGQICSWADIFYKETADTALTRT